MILTYLLDCVARYKSTWIQASDRDHITNVVGTSADRVAVSHCCIWSTLTLAEMTSERNDVIEWRLSPTTSGVVSHTRVIVWSDVNTWTWEYTESKGQNPLHQFPRSKCATSLQHKREIRCVAREIETLSASLYLSPRNATRSRNGHKP